MTAARTIHDPSTGPVWEVATLFPQQGQWSQQSYLDLTAESNRLIEFTDGRLEFLAMPKTTHQRILQYLEQEFLRFVFQGRLGEVLPCPLRVKLREGKFREPDLVFMSAANADRAGDDYWDGADLVVEIVSDEGRSRDLVEKRADYAEAGIPEYWIVDPRDEVIVVLTLRDGAYATHGAFQRGQRAASVLLKGFDVDVAATMDAAKKRS